MRKPYLLRNLLVKLNISSATRALERGGDSQSVRTKCLAALRYAKGDDNLTREAIITSGAIASVMATRDYGWALLLHQDLLAAAEGNKDHTLPALVACNLTMSKQAVASSKQLLHTASSNLMFHMLKMARNDQDLLGIVHRGCSEMMGALTAKKDATDAGDVKKFGKNLLSAARNDPEITSKVLALCEKSLLPHLIDKNPQQAVHLCKEIYSTAKDRTDEENLSKIFAICSAATSALAGKNDLRHAAAVAAGTLNTAKLSGRNIPPPYLVPYAELVLGILKTPSQFNGGSPSATETCVELVNGILKAAGRNGKDVFCREFQINGNTLTIHTADAPGPASGGMGVPSFPKVVKSWTNPAPG